MSKDADRLQLWDTQSATYGEFQFVGQGYRGSRVRFKGMEVNKGTPHLLKDGISVTLDVYGLDTKETITLDLSLIHIYLASIWIPIHRKVHRGTAAMRLIRHTRTVKDLACGPLGRLRIFSHRINERPFVIVNE